jgi:arylsulfatase A-like enzyme
MTIFNRLFASIGLMATLLTGCALTPPADRSTVQGVRQPNIVFILVDDLGWGDVSYHGSEIQTPNIDALAASGIKLERSYVFPICSPTRAALLSGRNPLAFGLDGPLSPRETLPLDVTLLPQRLKQSGYQTWMVGKWHLGLKQKAALPNARGFDHFYGFLGGYIDYYTHVFDGGLDWQRNGASVREPGHATQLLTEEAISLVAKRDYEKPFFLYLAYNAGHTPLQYVPNTTRSYDQITNKRRRVYAQMMTDLDTNVGKLVAALDRQKLMSNTIIVLVSDNGGAANLGSSNGNLRGGKSQSYEGGLRTPALISWRGTLRPGQTLDQPLFAQDWTPTLMEAAGIAGFANGMDGRSIWPSIRHNKQAPVGKPVVLGSPNSRAVYLWPMKLVQINVDKDNASFELYDVRNDPREERDIATLHPETVLELARHLAPYVGIRSLSVRERRLEEMFSDENGNPRFDLRLPETRAAWAESATAE